MKLKSFFKTISLTYLFSTFVLLIVPVSVFALDFAKPLAGDSRCGGAGACPITAIFPELKDIGVMSIVVLIFFALMAVIWAGVRGLMASNQAAVLDSTKKQLGVILTTIIFGIVFIGGIAAAFLNSSTTEPYRKFFGQFLSRINESPVLGVIHSYASGLPNPLVVNSVYDVGILFFQLAMRWIFVPVLIGSWVWAGFLFIRAQGNPKEITVAKERLMYSLIWTLILMFALGIAFAFQSTFNQIFSIQTFK